jgi:hypothetical protein
VVSLQGFDPPNWPGPLTPSAVASDSTGAAIPGLGGMIRGGPRSTSRHAIPPDNGCCLVRPEGRTPLSSRKLRLIPRRPSALPEGGASVRSGVGFRSRSKRRRPRAWVGWFDRSRSEDRSRFRQVPLARCVGLGRRRCLRLPPLGPRTGIGQTVPSPSATRTPCYSAVKERGQLLVYE